MKTSSKTIIFVLTLLALSASATADESPLFEALSKGDKAAVEALLARGADVNAKNKDGRTALCMTGKKDIAELLLSKGADINAKDNDGGTPLHQAAYS